MLTLLKTFVPLLLAASALAIENTVYIITNAETPSLHRPGLTPIGHHRAGHCIPEVGISRRGSFEKLRQFRFSVTSV